MFEVRQTNQFVEVISLILGIVDNYLAFKMKEAVDVAIQLQTNKLREEAQAENQEFLNQVDSTMKKIIKEQRGRDDQDKDEDLSAGSNRGSKRRRLGKETESSKEPIHKDSKSTSSPKGTSKSQPKYSGKSAYAEEHGQKVNDLDDQTHQEFNTGNDDVTPVRETLEDVSQWNPPSSLTFDREWHKTKTVDKRPHQPWMSQLAQATCTQSSFNEFLATPIDFSAFIMNWLKIDNLTQEDYFINNDLEYLKGGSSSKKYITFVTKTKAADYGYLKWIEDKRFYEYASNMESSYDVYSRHKIIAVTNLKIMEWFGYSHLEEIIVKRQDDKLYKFRKATSNDFKDKILKICYFSLFKISCPTLT
uniref:Uncharacterized protein n=1 Tax=Tanacetum cinerariifolium TaxID=118510 RepID=A0A699J6H9_TANCI|nr:hypothetical protein [Tanacetum cinerariifolium]